jgi:hypothetical protein
MAISGKTPKNQGLKLFFSQDASSLGPGFSEGFQPSEKV